VEKILAEKGEKIVSIILFGSMAKGTYTKHSDYDLLLIVSGEKLSFKERLYEYSKPSNGWVEALAYTREEAKAMLESFNPLILDALKDGKVIYDRGFWKQLKNIFEKLLAKGIITPKESGWTIRREKLKTGSP